MNRLVFFGMVLFWSIKSYGQTQDINMPRFNNSPGFEITYTTCNANFYDSGGKAENYRYGNNGILTFCPTTPGEVINIDFLNFDLQANHILRIYDGEDANAELLGSISNEIDGTAFFKASFGNTSGCLTLTFITSSTLFDPNDDASYSGWESSVFCTERVLEIGKPIDLVLNDDPSGDEVELFDLSQNDEFILNGYSTLNYQVSYYSSIDDANLEINSLNSSYLNNINPQTIYARLEYIASGDYKTTSFKLIVNKIPEITPLSVNFICDEDLDGKISFNISQLKQIILNDRNHLEVTFFNSTEELLANNNALAQEEVDFLEESNTIFYKLLNTNTGAFAIGEVIIEKIAPELNGSFTNFEVCKDLENIAFFDLDNLTSSLVNNPLEIQVSYHKSKADAETGSNILNSPVSFTEALMVYARVTKDDSCIFITEFELSPIESIHLKLNSNYYLCQFNDGTTNGPILLETGLDETQYDLKWYKDSAQIIQESNSIYYASQPGNYKVEITDLNTNCSYEFSSQITLVEAPESLTLDVKATPFVSNNTITSNVKGSGNYNYILDQYETNNTGIFYNVPPGEHQITAIDENGCSSVSKAFFIIGCPKFFTPNLDGTFDSWKVKTDTSVQIHAIFIFDRYGKLMKQLNQNTYSQGWDGFVNGRKMPSDNYWFKIEYTYNDELNSSSGYFVLKR